MQSVGTPSISEQQENASLSLLPLSNAEQGNGRRIYQMHSIEVREYLISRETGDLVDFRFAG